MAGIATARHIYDAAVETASRLWESARAGQSLSAPTAFALVNDLHRLLADDATALLALAVAPCAGDDPRRTFTHMVNVAALTMAQAASLHVDGPLLDAFGVAALLHDIGKVRTPAEILHKPDRLTPDEVAIMKRHVIDGAAILRRAPALGTLPPVVAFEHHVKEDLSGYPDQVGPRPLNLCTRLVSIADVFDGLRGDRPHRHRLATARIRAIMDECYITAFNRPLLTHFVGMLGLFPVGSLVRLVNGELAVVTRQRADAPMRPQVAVITTADGCRLDAPVTVRTWEGDADGRYPREIGEAVDPLVVGIDPLEYL